MCTSVLQRIKTGDVTLAFRRWRRPTVKRGGTLRTAIGVLAIAHIEKVAAGGISLRDARAAGYFSRKELLENLETYGVSANVSSLARASANRASSLGVSTAP